MLFSHLVCDEKYKPGLLQNWKSNKYVVLTPTKRKAARTAILIIAAPKLGDSYVECRWKLGKKMWEQYMNSHPNVDCYFVQSANPRASDEEQVWIEGNTIHIGETLYEKKGNDQILHKTILAMEKLLPHYTHFLRTNLNTVVNLKALNEYAETHHQSFYTTPLWEKAWYTIGYAILHTRDVGAHMVVEYRRLEKSKEELITTDYPDDAVLTSLATGVWPYDRNHPFSCCPSLPFGVRQLMCRKSLSTSRLARYGVLLMPPISLEEAIEYSNKAASTVILYRTRDGFDVDELGEFYDHLLYKIYPELLACSLSEYAKSLPSIKRPS